MTKLFTLQPAYAPLRFALILLLMGWFSSATLAQTRFVSTTGTNANPASATSWATSTTDLQGAINSLTVTGGEVWVAAGLYKPTTGTDRSVSFAMVNGVAIYGGFVGNETLLASRTVTSPLTGNPSSSTLSGEIGDPASTTDNSLHVISNNDLNNTALLDGFVVTGGYADGAFPDNTGGGLYNVSSSPELTNCVFDGNTATNYGGGMAGRSSSTPTLTDCVFQNNTASQGGGLGLTGASPTITRCLFQNNGASGAGAAMLISGVAAPVITNCVFQSNTASGAGAISQNNGTSRLINCRFINNRAVGSDGAMVVANTGVSTTLVNCSFEGNTANSVGVLRTASSGKAFLTNCSFQSNSATTGEQVLSNSASMTLVNCVLWGNGTPANTIAGNPTLSYCLYPVGTTGFINGGNNLTTTTSPFVSTTSVALHICSPAINAGDNSAPALVGITTDLVGNPRFFNGRYDMGAVEFQNTHNTQNDITAQPAAGSAVCPGGTATAQVSLSGTGGFNYQWYKSGTAVEGQLSATLTLSNITSASAGSYSVVATGSCNSVTSTVFTLTVSAAPTVTITTPSNLTMLDCNLTGITLTASGGGTYSWDNSLTTVTRNISGPNTYSVTVTGTNGCTTVATKIISQNLTPPPVSLTATDVCAGQSVTLTATSGIGSYTFVGGSGVIGADLNVNTTIVSGLSAGPYSFTVRVRSSENSCTNTATASASVTAGPSLTITPNPSLTITSGETATLTASGATSYSWLSGASTSAISVSTAGIYSVTGTSSGCSSTTSVTFRVRSTIGNRVYFDQDGDGIQDTGEPGIPNATVSIVWSGPDNTLATGDDVTLSGTTTGVDGIWSLTVLDAGFYRITVTPPANQGWTNTDTFDNGLLSAVNPVTPNVTASRSDIDFGFRSTGRIGNLVWRDTDQGGTQNSEPGLANVTIRVRYDANGNGAFTDADDGSFTAITSSAGSYSVGFLPPGNYRAEVLTTTLPANVWPTYDLDGITTPHSATTTLTLAQTLITVNFGYATPCYPVIYVTPTGAGIRDGSSWANAYAGTALQTAIDAATFCSGQVWIAAGTYKPTSYTGVGSRNVPFLMLNNVAIYGGFAGIETTLTGPTGRTLTMPSSTTFSGNIDNDNTNTNNSYHVVAGGSLNSTARLDGVVITGGNADNNLSFANFGAGILLVQSNPILANCVLESNTAVYGGGICNYISSPSMTNCVLQNNRATTDGGGLSSYLSAVTLTNCVIQNNSAASSGGGLFSDTGRPLLTNCTLQSNSATAGGAIGITGNFALTLTNSIVWNNGASNSFSVASGSLVANYSLFEPSSITAAGLISGPGNLTTSATPFASTTSVALNACTPAINAGNNSATGLTGITTDLVGNTRVFGGTVDMGAVEFQGTPASFTTTLTTGPSTTLTCAQTSLTLTATGGNSYTFAGPGLSQSGSSATALATQAGSYSVTAMNASGCTSVTSVSVSNGVNAPPVVSLDVPAGFVCGTSVSLTATSGLSNYTFTGLGGLISAGAANTATASNLPGGPNTFTVVAEDATGCQNTAVVSFTLNQFPGFTLEPVNQTVCVGATVSFATSVTGTPTPTAQWRVSTDNGGSYQVISGATSPTLTFVASLTDNGNRYRVTYTNGCGSTMSFGRTLTVIPPVGLTVGGILSCTQTSVTLTATTGQTSYTFGNGATQQGGSVGNTATVSTSDVYGVTALSGEGCVSSSTVLVQSDVNTPTVSLTPTSGTLTCSVTALTLTATATGTSLSYVFSGPGTITGSGNTRTVNTPGTYTVVITGSNGCTASATTTVNSNTTAPTLTVMPGSGTLTCSLTSLTLTASGTGTSYTWTGGTTGTTLPVSTSGTYSVTATASNGCSSTTSVVVSQSAGTPTAGLVASGTLTCSVTRVTLMTSGGNSYAFSGPSVVASSGNSATVNVGGVYSVTVTNTATGCSSVTTTTVSSNTTAPTVSISATSGTLTCAVTTLTLTATSSETGLLWSNAATTQSITVNSAGTYSVTATGANGCSAVSNSVVITTNTNAPTGATLTPNPSATLTCTQTSLTITASATGSGLSYVFAGPSGTLAGSGNTRPVSASGLYSVTITGANGCTTSASTTVYSNTVAPTVSIAPTSGTLTCAAPSLTLTATTSGTGVRWNTTETTPSIVVSTSGTYSVTATAANGCSSTTNVTINTNLAGSSAAPTLSASSSVVCAGSNVQVVATVGGSPTGLQWYKAGQAVSGQTSATLTLGSVSPNEAGSYVLVVSGGCGSVTSTAFNLTVNPLPTVTLLVPNNASVQGATITLPLPLTNVNFQVLGGVFFERMIVLDRINGFEIRQVDQNANGIFAINRPGSFRLTVTDGNGCRRTVEGVVVVR